jgi:hypothetical protein
MSGVVKERRRLGDTKPLHVSAPRLFFPHSRMGSKVSLKNNGIGFYVPCGLPVFSAPF